MNTNILTEIDAMKVGDVGSEKLSVYGNHPKLEVRANPFVLVSDNVSIAGNTIFFLINGKKFRGKLNSVWSDFNFKRIV